MLKARPIAPVAPVTTVIRLEVGITQCNLRLHLLSQAYLQPPDTSQRPPLPEALLPSREACCLHPHIGYLHIGVFVSSCADTEIPQSKPLPAVRGSRPDQVCFGDGSQTVFNYFVNLPTDLHRMKMSVEVLATESPHVSLYVSLMQKVF